MTLNEIAARTGVPRDYRLRALGVTAEIDPRSPVREWLREAVRQYRAGQR